MLIYALRAEFYEKPTKEVDNTEELVNLNNTNYTEELSAVSLNRY